MVYFLSAYAILSFVLSIYIARSISGRFPFPLALFLSILCTGILLALTAALLISIILFCPSLIRDILKNFRNSRNSLPFPVAAPINRNNIIKPVKATLFSLGFIAILAAAGCRKNPCFYNNCDGETIAQVPTECYISKKLVRQDTVILMGDTLTRFDVDTSYYLDCDAKILGKDSIIDNAGVFNIEPWQYCVNRYNYATVKVFDTLTASLNGQPVFLVKIRAVNKYFVWMQLNQKWKGFALNGGLDGFMYN